MESISGRQDNSKMVDHALSASILYEVVVHTVISIKKEGG